MKIGIITQYYKSENYGGNLQAYALCHALQREGYDAEQICYGGSPQSSANTPAHTLKSRLKRVVCNPSVLAEGTANKLYNRCVINNRKARSKFFAKFNSEIIPHSQEVYQKNNIHESNGKYDVFITGSDQVWNVKWYNPVYFLKFVNADKIKMSYAASISLASLTEEQKQIFRESITDYFAVSVREKSGVDLLDGIADAKWCLDPTLLLSKGEWDEVCTPKVIDGKYVLGFFLSGNKNFRKAAKGYAKKKGYTYIELPAHMHNFHFADKRMYPIGPGEFLSLIKHSEAVFTDSFHASVFSIIFNREFFVFARKDHPGMVARLIDLTGLFGCEERICDSCEKQKYKYFESVKPADYMNCSEEYLSMKEKSINFLNDNLNRAAAILGENEG